VNDVSARGLDRRALGVAISRAAASSVAEALTAPSTSPAAAPVIGVTGAPGAGKSTLIGRLVARRVRDDRTMAVLAIDPSSPRSGGSLLGDRIRMEAISGDPRVYIRSLPSAGAHDGLTDNIAEVLGVLDAFGFGEVLVETVGVGQAEYGVRALAAAEVLVLMPGAGDYVQAMKAGIIETADIFVVNKAELPGAERLEGELLTVLEYRTCKAPVIRVSARSDEGVDRLSEALDALLRARAAPDGEARGARQRFRLQSLVQRRLREVLDQVPCEQWRLPLADLYCSVLKKL
jgi:LAO/AO transport system kinase